MKKLVKSMAAASMLLVSLSTYAIDVAVEDKLAGNSDSYAQAITISVPVAMTGDSANPIDWDLTVKMLDSNTKTGRFVSQNVDGHYISTAIEDGSASYIVIGAAGRRMIINKYIEGVVKADYAYRTGGTTMYGQYSQKTGQLYNPYGGLNIGAGANLVLDIVVLGASVERNIETDETIVKLSLGARF